MANLCSGEIVIGIRTVNSHDKIRKFSSTKSELVIICPSTFKFKFYVSFFARFVSVRSCMEGGIRQDFDDARTEEQLG